jgi:hypothetical protein
LLHSLSTEVAAERSRVSAAICDRPDWIGGDGLLAFVLANTIWLRSAHLLARGWEADALAGSQIVQSGYSISGRLSRWG